MTADLLLGFAAGALIGMGIAQYRINQIKSSAATDTLTGLYNRAFLDKTLGRLLAGARRDKQSLSVMMIDLNHFKEANDRFGHPFGDQVLKAAAEAMVASLRQSDFIFRYGGDEFLIILPHTTPYRLTRPYVGLSPTVPVNEAGCLIEPPVSVPSAATAKSAATAAADPPPDPPGTMDGSHGLTVF